MLTVFYRATLELWLSLYAEKAGVDMVPVESYTVSAVG